MPRLNPYREVMGRCEPCGVTYRWLGAPRRRDALCPRCGGSLTQGKLRQSGKLLFERPTARAQVAS